MDIRCVSSHTGHCVHHHLALMAGLFWPAKLELGDLA